MPSPRHAALLASIALKLEPRAAGSRQRDDPAEVRPHDGTVAIRAAARAWSAHYAGARLTH